MPSMMHMPLLISSLADHAARYHGATEIISAETAGGVDRSTWGSAMGNARRLASALAMHGLMAGDRCGTISWNNRRHLEIYYGVAGGGMVCHTINPRLAPEQLVFIINDARDRVLFIDRTFVPLVAKVRGQIPTVRDVMLMGPRDDDATAQIEGLLFHDDLVAQGDPAFVWPALEETAPSSLCYTSGTTGNPKGVMYTHRSTVLHALACNTPDGLAISASDTVIRWCRCFTSTPGACPMSQRRWAASWCCRDRTSTASVWPG